ncbi:NAD(P)/FAD-dependent oxidoreductase [Azohydromonas lata]|uniref:NAD(P)/FAD-dependent oxidoreductase n=1 Tax=Azohydromonas lata TaxID=45677 RepID=UPI0008357FA4|nr:FAD-dependent oxidoreductase [Azohydromonas lata]
MTRHIVIVGGGFGGTTLARRLERRLPAPWQLTLVSEESTTTFNPLLAEVVGASVFPEQVVAPIRQMLKKSRFVMGRVTHVDALSRTVRAHTLAGERELPFDHLVLALGTRARLDLLPGLAEHALPLKLVGDAMFIRNRVLHRLARMELESDRAQRRRLGSFIVMGGGFSGVEVAGALADFTQGALRCYPRVRADEISVALLHDGARLLPELPECLGDAAARSLVQRGVKVQLLARVAAVQAQGVVLADGSRVEGDTVVCTLGTRENPLLAQLAAHAGVQGGLALQRGRLPTAPDMSVPGWPGEGRLWALGDCALVPNGGDGASPPTAQFAVAQARVLADNLVAAVHGQPTRAFSHRSRGMMATTGHLKGVAQVFGLRLAGLPAWLLWRAYYLLLMPTAGRKLRIWVEWTWSMLFSVDVTHLRFTRTSEADAEPAPGPASVPMPAPPASSPVHPPSISQGERHAA